MKTYRIIAEEREEQVESAALSNKKELWNVEYCCISRSVGQIPQWKTRPPTI